MGREWYFNWGSKSSSKKQGMTKGRGGGGGGGSDKVVAAVAASGGCMNGVLHMFDFNHFHLCLHPNNSSYLEDEHVPVKGVEAPRNSLESIIEDEKDNSLNIPMGIQIKTNRRDISLKLVQAPRAKVEDTLSQSSCSPTSARTPTLVARLMGLDILPESNNTTPRSSSSTPPCRTTRTRTKSSSNSNVVDPHRLSLQINKEKSIVKEMELSRPSCSAINTKTRQCRNYEDENKSPAAGYYAKQIMKQVKEHVSKRVGLDVTNTIAHREVRRDEHLLSTVPATKPKKSRKDLIKSSQTSNTISEKLSRDDLVVTMDSKRGENEKKVSLKHGYDLNKFNGTKPAGSKMAPKSSDFIKNKKDEQFVRSSTRANNNNNNNSSTDKKCKKLKTPLSSELVHASLPSIIPLNKLVEKQEWSPKVQFSKLVNNISVTMNTTTQLSRITTQRTDEKVQQEASHKPAANLKKNKDNTYTSTSTSTNMSSSSVAEFQYIGRILKCTGIDRDTPICFTRWFSPSHPLDPSIFHTIEATHYPTTAKPDEHSINRRLVFHLVDEILADILKPYKNKFKVYHYQKQEQINGFQLLKTLCTKLRSFPRKDCQTLQDIDGLVEKDMARFGESSNLIAFEAEAEAIVNEIEGDVVDELVQEMSLFLLRKQLK